LSTALIASPEKPGRRVPGVDNHFLTVQQVAELLHVSAKTVFNMTKDGRLPARRLPGSRRYLYVRQEILDLLDENRTEVSAPTPAEATEVDAEN
jgi:excisionase family DNA binding protein